MKHEDINTGQVYVLFSVCFNKAMSIFGSDITCVTQFPESFPVYDNGAVSSLRGNTGPAADGSSYITTTRTALHSLKDCKWPSSLCVGRG